MPRLEEKNRYFDGLFANPALMWLGQNTNHFPTHPAVEAAMIASIKAGEFHAYAPPAGIEELRTLIRDDLGLPGMSVLVTDGGVEGLYNACRSLAQPNTRFVTTDPGWKWPMAFARASGAEIVELPIYDAAQGYRLTPAQLDAAVDERTRLIYLVDPNNPLGIAYTAAEIEAFAAIARRANAYFIHDCTYRHFAREHTLAAHHYPERTITIYSFSKWLGLAGLRVGALVAHPDLIDELAAAPPNNLGSNVVSQRAAIAGLRVKDEWLPDVNARQRRNQAAIAAAVARVPGLSIPVYPSDANFLVIECVEAGISPEALVTSYREVDIMIRQGSYHTPRFGHRFVKVSTTVPEAWADAFCARLADRVDNARTLSVDTALF
jgi:aspartate aminotransferase